MEHDFRLFWRREKGNDGGTPVTLEDLEPVIRPRILELAGNVLQSETGNGPIAIHLPYLDRREWSRRTEFLRAIVLERQGRVIRPVYSNPAGAVRDLAAELVAGDPAWLAAPVDREHGSFRTWRAVSVAIQQFLRRSAHEIYFRDPALYENRPAAWPLLVYHALRPCLGEPETEFTYDVGDPRVLDEALLYIRRPLRANLASIQAVLAAEGRLPLARRYSPIWDEDIVRAVQKTPRRLLGLLGDETLIVDGVIAFGMSRNVALVKPFTRRILNTLRSFYDCDMRELAVPMLHEATRALENARANMPKAEIYPPRENKPRVRRPRAKATLSLQPAA